MTNESSYLTERLAERRRRVRSGIAGVALLLALGLALLLSHPMPPAAFATVQASGQTPAHVVQSVTLAALR